MTHQLAYAARTDRGLVRASNQDSVYAGDNLLVVADGMGGHAAGDMASRLVVSAFMPLDRRSPGGDLLRALARATRDGNAAISQVVRENPDLDGMGTTVTAVLFDGGRVGLAHVGDSRAYLYRDGVLHQLTHDDTFVQSLIDEGRISQEDAAHHPQRSLLLRALNGTEVDPSLTVREVSVGDRYLLCSDGLAGVVSAESIAEALGESDPETSANQLIQLALSGGGPDNITVIVADVMAVGGGDDAAAGVAGAAVAADPADPDATGPIGSYASVRMTQEMPRVPLPPIPEDVPARPEYATPLGAGDLGRAADSTSDESDLDDLDDDEPPPNVAPPRPPSRRGAVLAVVGGVLLVSAVVVGSFLWVNTQYFVGVQNDQVVVFRGVDGSVLGLTLNSVQETSCEPGLNGCTPLYVSDLVPAARDQVDGGIQAGSLDDARKVVSRLGGQLLPLCDLGTGTGVTTGVSGQPTGSSGPSRSALPSDSSAAPTATPGAPVSEVTVPSLPPVGVPSVPTGADVPPSSDQVPASDSGAAGSFEPEASSAAPTATGTPLSSRAPEPGVTCRIAR